MAMTAWSTTAANNVLANTGINMDEGMAPSQVNDSIREIMAVLKTAITTGNITATGTLAVTGVATLTAQPILSSLTASLPVFSDGSKGLVSNAMTGTGSVVMSASPTLTGTLTAAAITASGLITASNLVALGAANLKQFVNAAGTAPEWANGIFIGTFTHNTADATGTQAVTGVGFLPSKVVILTAVDGTDQYSTGFSDATKNYSIRRYSGGVWSINSAACISLVESGSVSSEATISAMGADGFTLSWVKTGAKTGSAISYYLAFR